MDSLPAHQPLFEDDTDDEMSDEQLRELLNEAAQRMQAKAASQPVTTAPFKLPKLRPGHIADTYETTQGNITRLDQSKFVDEKQVALANGIKKIDDPLQVKQQKEVCIHSLIPFIHTRQSLVQLHLSCAYLTGMRLSDEVCHQRLHRP